VSETDGGSIEAPTPRTRVRRLPELGAYDRPTVDAILDEAFFCHLAWVGDDGDPRVIPTIHVRLGDMLYIHGSRASTTLKSIREGRNVAVAVTLVDGIRFARSMFEHSMNYRTVIVYGPAQEITDMASFAARSTRSPIRWRGAVRRTPGGQPTTRSARRRS
jgi:nitroimidazol reductase NimA-like FMN-containing flavoprotein (pyridoxamine 5'-phosphate oxidase superfamily)